MRRNRRTVLLGLASASLIAACDPRSPEPPKPPLRLAIDLWAGYFPALLADELGYFRDAGLLVEISIPGNTALANLTPDITFVSKYFDQSSSSRSLNSLDSNILRVIATEIPMVRNLHDLPKVSIINSYPVLLIKP